VSHDDEGGGAPVGHPSLGLDVDATDGAGDSGWQDDPPDAEVVYETDPTAGKTPEERVAMAKAELARLMRSSVIATGAVLTLLLIADGIHGRGFDNSAGFALGAGTAALNLWILAGGYMALLDGRLATTRLLIAFGASFLLLVSTAAFVLSTMRGWTIGFGLGIASPALSGLVFARLQARDDDKNAR
jgi:hypothetical protein